MVVKKSVDRDVENLDIDKLTNSQIQALTLLAAGYTKDAVCEKLDISQTTIDRWCRIPEFKKLKNRAMLESYNTAVAEMMLHSKNAVIELNKIIMDAKTPPKTKISAIHIMLTHASKGKDILIEERLERIEEMLKNDD